MNELSKRCETYERRLVSAALLVMIAGCGPEVDPPLAPLLSGMYSVSIVAEEVISPHCGWVEGEHEPTIEAVRVGVGTLMVNGPPTPVDPPVWVELELVDDGLWELGGRPQWYCDGEYLVGDGCDCHDGESPNVASAVQRVVADQVDGDTFVLTRDFSWRYLHCPDGEPERGVACDVTQEVHYELVEACERPSADGC